MTRRGSVMGLDMMVSMPVESFSSVNFQIPTIQPDASAAAQAQNVSETGRQDERYA